MRFFVECTFPHLRKRGVASRKSAFWAWALTEKYILSVRSSRKDAFWLWRLTKKRILAVVPHGKAHSGCGPNLPVGIPPSAVTEDGLG